MREKFKNKNGGEKSKWRRNAKGMEKKDVRSKDVKEK